MEEHQDFIDEIYKEMLYEICNPVGMHEYSVGQESMFTYLQNAFKVRVQNHMDLLKAAKLRKPPNMRLNVEIVEAKNLPAKDSNGLADPFVTLNLASDDSPAGSYETEVKLETLRPVWNEKFSFTVEKEICKEVLKVQIWDFDPAETTGEKLQKIYDVKGIKGFGRFLKEIIGPSGKEVNELIGSVEINLDQVPAVGDKKWYTLEKLDKMNPLGEVHIGLSFGSLRDSKATEKEHRVLVKQFLLEQIEVSKVGDYQCTGNFCAQAINLLTQHAVQGGLSEGSTAFIRWVVFCEMHQSHRLSFLAFNELLRVLTPHVKGANGDHKENRTMFWNTLTTLTVTIFDWLKEFKCDKEHLETLKHMLEFLAKIDKMSPPIDLFPKQYYGDEGEDGSWNIEKLLIRTTQERAKSWFESIRTCQDNTVTNQEQGTLNYIDLVEIVRTEFEMSVLVVDPIFLSIKNFKYAQYLLQVYDSRLDEEIQPFITVVCGNLAPIDTSVTDESEVDKLVGKSIFKLFMELRKFLDLGRKVSENEETLKLKNFHVWFLTAVHHWLDASIYKAKLRIAKAIELDTLQPLDDTNRNSTSAVDTLTIFYQVFKFWGDLEWPDASSGYTFVRKIIEEMCDCCNLYMEKMTQRATSLKGTANPDSSNMFEVAKEWCCVINNLDYMRNNLEKMVEDFRVDMVVARLPVSDQSESSEQLNTIIVNALEKQRLNIESFIDEIKEKMAPNLESDLLDGAAHLHKDSTSLDKLMVYLDESLKVLNSELSVGNFEKIMDKIWLEICRILENKTKATSGDSQPIVYANLLKAVDLLLKNFQCEHENKEDCLCKVDLDNVIKKLQLFGYETDELIHQFYVDRFRAQGNMCNPPKNGLLTIQCSIKENILKVEVMNAKDLIPLKSKRSTNIYAKIYLLPAHKFNNIKVPKTKAIRNSMFPMFDEEIEICLTDELKSVKNALLMIRVKDKRLFGYKNQYMADCLVSFDQIMENNGGSQMQLPLHRTVGHDFASIEALSSRKSDRKAQKLLKKLKTEKCIPLREIEQ